MKSQLVKGGVGRGREEMKGTRHVYIHMHMRITEAATEPYTMGAKCLNQRPSRDSCTCILTHK